MVEFEKVGKMITIFLMITGAFMTAIPLFIPPMPDGDNDFGLTQDLNQMTVSQNDTNTLVTQFNSDMEQLVSSSDLVSQIWFGGSVIVTGARLMFGLFIQSITGWTKMVDLMFGFAPIPHINLIKLPIILFLTIIMVLTILKFIGGVIKSLPFFGGG